MEDTGLIFDQLFESYGLKLEPLNNHNDFLIELVKLSHLGIRRGDRISDFHDKITRLLEYVLRTEASNLTLLLTDTLIYIQTHAKFYLTDNATNVRQLCDLILIQFSESKFEIYYNTMKLLNCCEGSFGKINIRSILKEGIQKMDANIYECFHLALSLELLHTYIILDMDEFKTLFIDMVTDWKMYDEQVKEEYFEKLLWYNFAIDNKGVLKELVTDYRNLIKSDRWGIKFYRFINQKLTVNSQMDFQKLDRLINRFNKMNSYSTVEKEFIINSIFSKIRDKNNLFQEKIKEQQKTKKITQISSNNLTSGVYLKDIKQKVIQLSPYNLPTGVRFGDIKQKIIIDLAVYENEHMIKIIKKIRVNALTDCNKIDFYITKPELQQIKKEAESGYIHVINDRKGKKKKKNMCMNVEKQKNMNMDIRTKNSLFKWPSTDVTGTFDSENNSNELKTVSELREMGYQITNSTRENRWRILQQAVPTLGLKKVAYIIAGNVKLRKGQKNGYRKFSYAISEWEHDLQRLKNTFYKKDFNWPRT